MRRRTVGVISSVALTLSLSSCGASNSTVGTSANNCLIPLAAALRSHHQGTQLLGVRLVSSEVAMRYHFIRSTTHRDVCLVGFRLSSSASDSDSMVVYAYYQSSSKVVGVRTMQRHRFRINHLL